VIFPSAIYAQLIFSQYWILGEKMRAVDFYLFAYNAVQILGWSSILFKTVDGLTDGLTFEQIYNNVEWELQVFQTAAILEVNF
jgi:hypothetical protein